MVICNDQFHEHCTCVMMNLLPLTPNQFLHETMATPKETAEMHINRARLARGKVKEASNVTPARSSNRHNGSLTNSTENSPLKGAKSPIKKAKSPAKKAKSPSKKSKSPNTTQPATDQVAFHTE
jgi:hypothetical protein